MNDQINILQTEVYKFNVPLKAPFITAFGKEENAENIVVVLRTDKGISGFGECNPFLPINGENIDTCYTLARYFATLLKGSNALDISGCLARMDRFIYANQSIKSAFDMALHDIAAQAAGVPLYVFLGGKKNKTLSTDYTVSIGEVKKMVYDAIKIKADGFPAIKINVGEGADPDIERVKAIREAVGPDIPLRMDANQGWSPEDARKVFKALKKTGIEFCEEPILRKSFHDMQKLRKHSSIPIMADETCCDDRDARLLIEMKACDKFNIKVGKAGSLQVARRILKQAEKAKMDCQIGAFMESRLAMTAFGHLALSSKAVKYCDFDTPLMHAEDYVTGGIQYQANGEMTVPDSPGLGASIEPEILKRMESFTV